jgi:hypothetical protein
VIGAIVIAFTIGLLAFWFRYACGLILSANPAHDHTVEVASANELNIIQVQQELSNESEPGHLDILQAKLERDYHLLNYLVHHSPALKASPDVFERHIMMLDFELLKVGYVVTVRISQSLAKRALREMTRVVCYFANTMAERAGCAAAAAE